MATLLKKKPNYSLKTQIIGLMAVSLLLGSAFVSLISYQSASHEIDELFDAQLTQVSRLINHLIELHQALPNQPTMVIKGWLPKQDFEHGHEASSFGHEYERKFAFQVWDENNQLILRSESAPQEAFTAFKRGYQNVNIQDEGWRVFTLKDEQFGYWLQVAERFDVRAELVNEIVLELIFPFLIGIPLICLICGWIINKSFLSLTALKNNLSRYDIHKFSLINIESKYKEVNLVIDALNDLLKRNKAMVEKEKYFIEDAAHELRTPLSVIKIYAQSLQSCRDGSERQGIYEKLTKAIERSERMTSQLLTTSRLGLDDNQVVSSITNLEYTVPEIIEELVPLALKNQQTIHFDIIGRTQPIQGENTLLQILVKNLVDNAITYSGHNSEITVRLVFNPEYAALEVIDNGPGINNEAKSRVFDRFFRITSGDTKGAGLGLSIVKQIANLHHAAVSLVDTNDSNGLTVIVQFKYAHRNIKMAS